MIECQYVQHVSLAVTDLKRARRFYKKVLGLKEIERPKFHFPGAWFAAGAQQLHLIVNPRAQTLRDISTIDSMESHFAIRIANYDAAIRHLSSLGVPFVAKPDSVTGWKQIYVCDPDCNVIELNSE
ncbi:VOC family protein [Alicyclobacillus fastidiosus]|uniref:VOC family protein n=1 Tax=Alicyclobacillus fastidiosus TaxID=392011 RepID=A0ABY6ZLR6_9BACL|nr:VOC family protein [Alicyclobacillus fastidiosus]WAH43417.1 VOC family protein [Alicyclobacillus fastidiosus]GMA59563.1 glyoxalase [Alicyclobacillus fastidiosus]GMA65490.1 glyoxalase [Alicyclobacillus fastidiosus]